MSTLQYVKEIISKQISTYQNPSGEDKKALESEPYHNLQKSSVLLESRCFNDPQLQDKKCRQILSKLIYLINQGEKFNDQESLSLFFGITKLFSSNNVDLRRMIYLMIKEFKDENSMYVVISCLAKDITSKNDLFRINALRTLPYVLDQSNLVQLDRYLKNAILEKSQPISSAALIAGLQIFRISSDFIRKWTNEVADRLNSKYPQNSFHALILLHEIKSNDKVTFTKILTGLTKETLVPIANMQVIRFIREILNSDELDQQYEKVFTEYLLRQIHKSQEIVIFEACKALCDLKCLSNKDLQPMVQVVTLFLSSNNVINKFVALKILNRLISNPIRRSLISSSQIEPLIQDSNKSLSSLAVSILLKVCQETNIERLLNQIFEYLNDMSDEFKIDVLRSVKALAKNSPNKWKPIIHFLQQTFKCEASQEFKKYSIEIFEFIIHEIPEARETAILALADYIEDCQHSALQLSVLSILNREASKKQCPTRVIRIVNNRLHLEDAEIRAAAVGVLGKFLLHYPNEKVNLLELLSASAQDPDEEVRNRSKFYVNESAAPKEENTPLSIEELDAIEAYLQQNIQEIQQSNEEILQLEKIMAYAEQNKGKIKKTEVLQELVEEELIQTHEAESGFETYKKLFKESTIFCDYGVLRKSSKAFNLTDSKCEYLVTVVKHFFDNHIILEYKVKNTLDNVTLNDVSLELTIKNQNLQFERIVPAKQIQPQCVSNILVGLQFNPNLRLVQSNIQSILTFTVNENGTSYQDEYQTEDFMITYSDFFLPIQWFKKFQNEWESLKQQEMSATYQLDYKNTDIAIKELVKHFGFQVCDNSDQIQIQNKFHTLLLSGKYLDNKNALVICQIGFQQNIGCVLKIKSKSEDDNLSTNIVETLV
ncbi:unnamed protein product [Paramecium sonneborni]|uniref:Coatomer subunit gamma n=1 Tax=Paramecium sonneborni TaxID=65129 RepID=A0A8S1JTH9_9CILI|nr:unnamed protein product [Paramecium sonneborni]